MRILKDKARSLYRRGGLAKTVIQNLGLGEAGLALRYAAGLPFPGGSDERHLDEALGWLRRAQDATGDGVSALYSLAQGWDVPYPETSGYIIATFLAASDRAGHADLEARARRIGDWEIAIQAPTGGVYSRPGSPQTRVFNTGQVILGWCHLYETTNDSRYLEAAMRAGTYLTGLQEADGTWVKDTHCGARTYHARTDWGLLRLWRLSGMAEFADAAHRNLRWVLAQQQSNGWFRNCGFHADDPITHVIDYTLIGVLESALLAPDAFDRRAIELVEHSADAICAIVERSNVAGIRGLIPASFNSDWESNDDNSCLTGNAQLAYTLYRLGSLTGRDRYVNCADQLVHALKRTQTLSGPPEIRGAVPGSFPMYKGYVANAYPNWAAKFFADALLASLNRGGSFSIPA